MQIQKLCKKFGVYVIAKKEIKKGIINSTMIVTDADNNKYIFQEINSGVFKDVEKLMDNIAKVSEHIHEMHAKTKNSIDTYNLLKSGNKFYITEKDEHGIPHYFRMYKYISNASTYDEANEQLLFEAGVGFGSFQKLLNNFPAGELYETIPDFHNTRSRYNQFLEAMQKAKQNNPERYKKAKWAIEFAQENKSIAGIIMDQLENNNLPIRVVHNDTKLNNVMLSDKNRKPVAVIDLDTVMPGSLLFDYGDAIRFCASTAPEDETNLKLIDVNFNKLQAFTKGYLKETANVITEKELEFMPEAPKVLAYELGLRFLTDYLNGDKYFKVNSSRVDHNLERAVAQFTLTDKLDKYNEKIRKIINKEYLENIKNKTKHNATNS